MPPRATALLSGPSCDAPPEQKSSEPNTDNMPQQTREDSRRAQIKQLGKTVLLPLGKLEQRYISPQDLGALRVTSVKPLNFYTGAVGRKMGSGSSQSEQYIRPISRNQMLEWLNANEPWKVDGQRDIWVPSKASTAQHEANFLWNLIKTHLTSDRDGGPGLLFTQTPWLDIPEKRSIRFLERLDQGILDWQVKNVYQQAFKAPTANMFVNRSFNPEKPHVMTFLADSAPLQKDKISTSEMTALVYLTTNSSIQALYRQHRFYPATIVSASDRRVRVIQCVLDAERSMFEIRQTPIIDFEDGVWENSKNLKESYVALLGWLSSEAVGRTR
ncbi:hypothetical protein B0T10DRAFT_548938 [Thelonectria olida]|uniref:Uncharacterized protein n=1 Tax=Thelonectria olida TaxID=1576542 RepID=A0A9P9ANQ8_9HYPO|nr:hypothetical protein B0T10DRAFT_548938 [Thelonectria olida]